MSRGRASRLHFVGIGGRAMGSIAAALAASGDEVTGSDQDLYEPMRSWLRKQGIDVRTPFAAANVPESADAVVIGMRVTPENPELRAILASGLPRWSFPALLRHRYLARSRNLVVVGGVGKTTTTAMLAWILECAGRQPDYLIGGRARNLDASARFAGAALAVLEGDEYASSFEDPRPKFLHYRPETLVVTNVLADHPDLYPDAPALAEAFGALIRDMPSAGCLVLPVDDPSAPILAAAARCRVVTVGDDDRADERIVRVDLDSDGSSFLLGGVSFRLRMHGLMNVRNAAAAAVAAEHVGVPYQASALALSEFKGVVNRQDAVDLQGWTLVMDKATHPRSIHELSRALRQRYPGRRHVCALQPRATGGRRWTYQRELPAALAAFDEVLLVPAYEHKPRPGTPWAATPFCTETLAGALDTLGVRVTRVAGIGGMPLALQAAASAGDVVLLSIGERFVGDTLQALGVADTTVQ